VAASTDSLSLNVTRLDSMDLDDTSMVNSEGIVGTIAPKLSHNVLFQVGKTELGSMKIRI